MFRIKVLTKPIVEKYKDWDPKGKKCTCEGSNGKSYCLHSKKGIENETFRRFEEIFGKDEILETIEYEEENNMNNVEETLKLINKDVIIESTK